MATLLELRRRVRSVKNIRQITRAMKLVAGAKLRRAQEGMLEARPYSDKMWEVLGELSRAVEGQVQHPLLQVRAEKHITAVVLTSDRGLCGAFNSNALKYAHRALQVWGEHEVKVVTVGSKGWDHFRRRRWPADKADDELLKQLSFPRAAAAAQYLVDEFVAGRTDAVYLIYNEFVSALRQRLVVEPLLPIRDLSSGTAEGQTFRQAARAYAEARARGEEPQSSGAMGAAATGHGASQETSPQPAASASVAEIVDYIFEPSAQAIIDQLLPRFVEAQFYQALLESSAAEQAARMVAMDNATKNAEELIADLTLTMNKLRQEAITTEILEVVGGAEALG